LKDVVQLLLRVTEPGARFAYGDVCCGEVVPDPGTTYGRWWLMVVVVVVVGGGG
jgi:hypothetical protein